jgi:hypothetical protein
MDLAEFKRTLSQPQPPPGLDQATLALWWDAKGDWTKAHACAQAQDDAAAAWVHAYLHRKEGDAANADYWYRRAERRGASRSLVEEWEAIARVLLAKGG